MIPDFQGFPKIHRWSRDVIVTEKIDGTNAQVYITESGELCVGSRKRWITPENDNHGFAQWAHEHRDELLTLGPGRHFGEWWGSGIQRGYGLKNGERRFSLFNVTRWADDRPACCHIVPVLWRGTMDSLNIGEIMDALKGTGSLAAPGFPNPEGIVIYHTQGNTLFKKTFDSDEGKSHA